MDRDMFYDMVRSVIGPLSQDFVDGTNALLDEGEARSIFLPHMAYVLATAYHETGATMQPIAEWGKGEGHEYGKPCAEHGGQKPYGRGYVQLTWCENYVRADDELELDGALIADFELALDPEIAAQIIFEGMLEGWFTGQKLNDHINDDQTDYYEARTIVNGHDDAQLIANYAYAAEQALRASGFGEEAPIEPEEGGMNQALTDRQNELRDVIDELEKMKT